MNDLIQRAFQSGPTGILVPIRHGPTLLSPGLVYFFIYRRSAPGPASLGSYWCWSAPFCWGGERRGLLVRLHKYKKGIYRKMADKNIKASKISPVQLVFCIILGGFLLLAGFGHLTVLREEFLAQVPTWLPVDGDLVVVLSGIVEVLLGLGLIILPHRVRVIAGWAAAAFFVIIFPGNVSQYVNRIDAFGLNSDLSRFIRLFFQPVFVIWALWSTGAWQAWRKRKLGG